MSYQEPDELFSKPTIEQFYNAWQETQRQRVFGVTSEIELVRELIKRLKLNRTEEQSYPLSYEYYDGPNKHGTPEGVDQEAPYIINFGPGLGYANFCCTFYFDKDGKLINYGVWE